jgi:hypothetical protein
VCPHRLRINVETGWGIFLQNAITDQPVEIFLPLQVDPFVIEADVGRKIDFRFADMEERHRISGGLDARFVGIEDIVGTGRNALGVSGPGSESFERS